MEQPKDVKFTSRSGIPLKEVYTPSDLKEWDYKRKLSSPGEYPFTRGRNPPSQPFQWSMMQYTGFGTAASTNEALKYALAQGARSLAIALDLPTQCGYDSDNPMAHGEVGKIGVAVSSLQDVETLYKDIPLEGMAISTGGFSLGPIGLAWMLALCEKRKESPEKIRLSVVNEPLKEFISRGAYIFPPKQSVKFAADVIEYCHRNKFVLATPLRFCGYHIREGGASAFQTIAITLANAVAYYDEVQSRGIEINSLTIKPSFFLWADVDFFETVAVHRAIRRMWAKIAKERYNCQKPEHLGIFIHDYTLGSTLTAQQPLNNVVRCTIEALGAILGGAESMVVSSYDEALCLPSPEALRVALRTQQIIAHESGVVNTIDPLGGSYYVESLTDEIEKRATALFEEVEKMGGTIKAIEDGFYEREITKTAYQYLKDLETARSVMVGVNKYQVAEEKPIKVTTVSMAEERRQIQKLKKLRRERDSQQTEASLKRLKEAAQEGVNLVDPCVEAVKAYATVGEMCDVLSELWGRYRKGGILA